MILLQFNSYLQDIVSSDRSRLEALRGMNSMCKVGDDIIQHTTNILDLALSKWGEDSEDRILSRTFWMPFTFTKQQSKT